MSLCRMMIRKSWVLALVATCVASSSLFAADAVIRKGGKRDVGQIKSTSKLEVVLTLPANKGEAKIPANEVEHLEWDGEFAEFRTARSQEANGRYTLARDNYEKAKAHEKYKSVAGIKTDVDAGLARCVAKLALTDPSKVNDGIVALEAFRKANADTHHFYDVTRLLAQLYAAKKDFPKAQAEFDNLAKSPWKDYKMQAKVALGRLLMLEGKPDEAGKAFDEVIGMTVDSPQEESQRLEAQLGRVRILVAQSKANEALKLVDEILAKSSPADTLVQAEAYIRQGECYLAQGRSKDALLAYLHVDVLFSNERTQHAEALYHLNKLWLKVGQTGRANEAREKLNEEYPNSEWAKQLKSADKDTGG